ncbi:MAG: DNA helicase RecQ [Planctomycetota bacterium]|jgi:ATP-dependent DNA helicase RecQ|nr:DNA helicase RecQ [Planctomycetota bacterium]
MPTPRLEPILSAVFGFSAFRPHQKELVSAILENRDVFAVMPTGGGKSLCYQLPACVRGGVGVVVSPLISLMKDQVDAANANGIPSVTLNSALSEKERADAYRLVRRGNVRLVYVSPERFNSPGFTEYLKTLPPSFFAVDEAHCISEWGHDFRPDYLSLGMMTREFAGVPVAAFTATATPRVAEDIVERLGLRDPFRVRASFNRANLTYRVIPKEDLGRQLLDFLREREGEPGIVYRTTRKSVEATTSLLRRHGINARPYHAGMTDAERTRSQEDFRHDRCQVVVATIAFGMGIDKPNVRFVAHGDLPKNLEGYYQETGRAGRDGEPARCVLFHNNGDIAQLLRFNAAVGDPVAREAAQAQLNDMIAFARADRCRRAALLEYFGEAYPEPACGGCDICLGEAEREDATVAAQKALSAMIRTGNRFGANHIADILVGADTEKIRKYRHNELPTHGVGRDRDKTYWRRVIEALVVKGLAATGDSRYPIPAVTDRGWRVLRGEEGFRMLRAAEGKRSAGRGEAAPAAKPYDRNLFARLRQLRTRLAEEKGLPPYMIFADRALRDMARLLPGNERELLAVSGVGAYKLQIYGGVFLREIGLYKKALARGAESSGK